jgi:RimJ/RimL family protein N-acetyltransferase
MDARITPVVTDNDLTTVARLGLVIWNEHYVPIIGQAQVDYMIEKFQSEEAVRRQITLEGYIYYLITVEGEAVGYIGIVEKEKEMFLSKLYLLDSERGKGLARTALRFLASLCREKGMESITLTVNRNNLNSIAAYEKMGFEKYGTQVSDIGSGYVMDDYLMRKRIV